MDKIFQRLDRLESLLLATQKDVLNIDELVAFTGLSKSFIYKCTHQFKIPFYKQAKHLYFDRAEIVKWLKENRFAPSDELEKQASTYSVFKRKAKNTSCKNRFITTVCALSNCFYEFFLIIRELINWYTKFK